MSRTNDWQHLTVFDVSVVDWQDLMYWGR